MKKIAKNSKCMSDSRQTVKMATVCAHSVYPMVNLAGKWTDKVVQDFAILIIWQDRFSEIIMMLEELSYIWEKLRSCAPQAVVCLLRRLIFSFRNFYRVEHTAPIQAKLKNFTFSLKIKMVATQNLHFQTLRFWNTNQNIKESLFKIIYKQRKKLIVFLGMFQYFKMRTFY